MKAPQILHIDIAAVDNAVTLWRSGGLVAIPTETVYGLSADASNGLAVAKIFATKSRPQFNPLIVHVADIETAKRYVEWNQLADKLAMRFWPGPLTLVLKRRADCEISELVSAGGDTLAIRIPAHPITQQLLKAFGGGLAAPSANRSGRVSPTTAAHVREEFGDTVTIIDGGACEVGLESTVVDVSGDVPIILRPGSITRKMLEEAISGDTGAPLPAGEAGFLNERSEFRNPGEGASEQAQASHRPHPDLQPTASGAWANPTSPAGRGGPASPSVLKSPGQLESHYAPSIPVRLNATEVKAHEALLAFGSSPLTGAARTINLSARGDLIEAAANLFAAMRALDDATFTCIAVMPIPADGIGEAINDRLKRAAV